ncbi:uncharacterized protein [Rutidosis leptorrhynchoides]|uniref:uncharacterized protein n=1 Tax=Rutidosis leptorrhynchoides TaxID=125765 RepID=UPI003A9A4F09
MDFVIKLPRNQKRHDMIWVIVDRLTKSAHFMATREIASLSELAKLYVKETVSHHGVSLSIVSDRDSRFVSNFWNILQQNLRVRKLRIAREKSKAARDRQKMYADLRRRQVTFNVGDRVYLKDSSWKEVIGFGKCSKLAPMFIGSFMISEIIKAQTVVLGLPPALADIHNTFNACYLCKCKLDDKTQLLPLIDLKVDLNKKLVEDLIRIVD